MRKTRPYSFIGQTSSLCEDCLAVVPAKIIRESHELFYLKRCKAHGVQKTRVSSDAAYTLRCRDFLKPGDMPLQFQTRIDRGCPHDCGLCPDHEQHSCLALIEINEHCNLTCPVCFADSAPAKTGQLSLATIERMMDRLVDSEGEPDLLQISGGEPTLHPQFFEILDAAKARPIRHLMVNTNGLKLARDPDFAKRLADYKPGFEVYLQFDSLSASALKHLRGADLTRIRQQALENLAKHDISTTLVATVKKGVNDQEVGAIVEHALTWSQVRGVTFQPVQDAGRNQGFTKDDRVLLTDIRRSLIEAGGPFGENDLIPLPCNPFSIAIGYGLRNGSKVTPVTQFIAPEMLAEAAPNAVTFEKHPELREKLIEALSLTTTDANAKTRLHALLCCLPEIEAPQSLGYDSVFRVSIVEFLDRFNFCIANVKRSCVHFVVPDGRIIPFDTFNLFYRDQIAAQAAE